MTDHTDTLARIDAAKAALERLGDQVLATAGRVSADYGPSDQYEEGQQRARDDINTVLAALTPEPPTDDEREALVAVLRNRSIWHSGATYEEDAAAILDALRNRHRGPITDEAVERRITFQYGPNPPQCHSGFGTHDDLQRHIESVTAGPVHILKRESRTIGYGAWVDEAARDAEA